MAISETFDDLSKLDCIDWELMGSQYWNDTIEDGDRKRRRQAEFLVYKQFPWKLVNEIAVMTELMKSHVESLIISAGYSTPIWVRRAWYYS
jgi:hypothetical protein